MTTCESTPQPLTLVRALELSGSKNKLKLYYITEKKWIETDGTSTNVILNETNEIRVMFFSEKQPIWHTELSEFDKTQ